MPDQEFDQAELMAAFEAAKGTPTEQPTAESVVDPPVETQPTVDTPPPVETAEPEYKFNASDWLKERTEGYIDSEDKFKELLPKLKNYDDLETKLKDTESRIPKFTNEESQKLYEAWTSGNQKAVFDYMQEKNRDYSVMSDLDVIRESLAKEHPSWDKKGVELELRVKYGKQLETIDLNAIDKEENPDEYREAQKHNEQVEENLIRIQRDARDARIQLIENQTKIVLPELAKAQETTTQPSGPSAEQLQAATEKWVKDVEDLKLQPIKYTIDDKEVEYGYTEQQTKEFTEKMKNFRIGDFAKERGWLNEDGTTNAKALSEDVRWLLDREKIVKSFGTQMNTLATKEALKKIKNIPGETTTTSEVNPEPGSMAEAYTRARQEAGW